MKFTSPATTSNVRTDGFRITWMSDQDVRSEDHGEGGGEGGETIKQEKVFVFPAWPWPQIFYYRPWSVRSFGF